MDGQLFVFVSFSCMEHVSEVVTLMWRENQHHYNMALKSYLNCHRCRP